MVARTHLNVTLYVHCLPCNIIPSTPRSSNWSLSIKNMGIRISKTTRKNGHGQQWCHNVYLLIYLVHLTTPSLVHYTAWAGGADVSCKMAIVAVLHELSEAQGLLQFCTTSHKHTNVSGFGYFSCYLMICSLRVSFKHSVARITYR